MSAPNVLREAAAKWASNHGFAKRGGTWLCDAEAVTIGFDLQKSNYGAVYYVNVGIWFPKAEVKIDARTWKAHAYTRLSALCEKSVAEKLDEVSNLDSRLGETERAAVFEEILSNQLEGLLAASRTPHGFVISPTGQQFLANSLISMDGQTAVSAYAQPPA